MFGSIFRRVEQKVDNKIDQALGRLGMGALFVVAAAFGVAALADYLIEMYGARTANMMLAGGFAVLGILAGLISWMRSAETAQPAAAAEAEEAAQSDAPSANPFDDMSAADRELLLGVMSAAAPVALSKLIGLAGRNLPLIVSIAAAVFFATRAATAGETADVSAAAAAPAE
jgi:hypothetical protein